MCYAHHLGQKVGELFVLLMHVHVCVCACARVYLHILYDREAMQPSQLCWCELGFLEYHIC